MKQDIVSQPTTPGYPVASNQAAPKAKRNLKKALTMALAGYTTGGIRTIGLVPKALARLGTILDGKLPTDAGPKDISAFLDHQMKAIDVVAKFLPYVIEKESGDGLLNRLASLSQGNQGQIQINFHQHFQQREAGKDDLALSPDIQEP